MIILASSSQARKNLLEKAKIDFAAIPSNFDENSIIDEDLISLVKRLSFLKAKVVMEECISSDKYFDLKGKIKGFLGCDSMFIINGISYGKPKNKDEAFKRWEIMSSNKGMLFTGHSLILNVGNKDHVFLDDIRLGLRQKVIGTEIIFEDLSSNDISEYISSGEPFNCAGGFAIDGQGSSMIKSINGCYTNVIGLSIPWLKRNIKNL